MGLTFFEPGAKRLEPKAMETPSPSLLWDRQRNIPLDRLLAKDGNSILLTPVVAPPKTDPPVLGDPFEPLARAILTRQPRMHHVPYTRQRLLTDQHSELIKNCNVILFVITGPPGEDEPSQSDVAHMAASMAAEGTRMIIISCCDIQAHDLRAGSFSTIVQVDGYDAPALEQVAELLFSKSPIPLIRNPEDPRDWQVDFWNVNRDLDEVHELWCECLPSRFHLARNTLSMLLHRDGYARHLVVRSSEPGFDEAVDRYKAGDHAADEPEAGPSTAAPPRTRLLGFCATYTTYADSGTDRVLGSLAALFVRQSHRGRGIGRSLHDLALRRLSQDPRAIEELQLGSAFPRLLLGLPSDVAFEGWFRRRGWRIRGETSTPGPSIAPVSASASAADAESRDSDAVSVSSVSSEFVEEPFEAADWVLDLKAVSGAGAVLESQNDRLKDLTFERCQEGKPRAEFDGILEFVDRISDYRGYLGWYDQFLRVAGTVHASDVLVGREGEEIVCIALVYHPGSGSLVMDDLPWAQSMGPDVGGLTCVCIREDISDSPRSNDMLIKRLVQYCSGILETADCNRLYMDNIRGDEATLRAIGFKRWARYMHGSRAVEQKS